MRERGHTFPTCVSADRILKTAGFVVERLEGRSRLYRADQAALGSGPQIAERR